MANLLQGCSHWNIYDKNGAFFKEYLWLNKKLNNQFTNIDVNWIWRNEMPFQTQNSLGHYSVASLNLQHVQWAQRSKFVKRLKCYIFIRSNITSFEKRLDCFSFYLWHSVNTTEPQRKAKEKDNNCLHFVLVFNQLVTTAFNRYILLRVTFTISKYKNMSTRVMYKEKTFKERKHLRFDSTVYSCNAAFHAALKSPCRSHYCFDPGCGKSA